MPIAGDVCPCRGMGCGADRDCGVGCNEGVKRSSASGRAAGSGREEGVIRNGGHACRLGAPRGRQQPHLPQKGDQCKNHLKGRRETAAVLWVFLQRPRLARAGEQWKDPIWYKTKGPTLGRRDIGFHFWLERSGDESGIFGWEDRGLKIHLHSCEQKATHHSKLPNVLYTLTPPFIRLRV